MSNVYEIEDKLKHSQGEKIKILEKKLKIQKIQFIKKLKLKNEKISILKNLHLDVLKENEEILKNQELLKNKIFKYKIIINKYRIHLKKTKKKKKNYFKALTSQLSEIKSKTQRLEILSSTSKSINSKNKNFLTILNKEKIEKNENFENLKTKSFFLKVNPKKNKEKKFFHLVPIKNKKLIITDTNNQFLNKNPSSKFEIGE